MLLKKVRDFGDFITDYLRTYDDNTKINWTVDSNYNEGYFCIKYDINLPFIVLMQKDTTTTLKDLKDCYRIFKEKCCLDEPLFFFKNGRLFSIHSISIDFYKNLESGKKDCKILIRLSTITETYIKGLLNDENK